MKNWQKWLLGISGVVGGVLIFSAIDHHLDYHVRKNAIMDWVKKYAKTKTKPVINIGCRCIDLGGVNVDVVDRSNCVKNFVLADAENLYMFYDKQFSVAVLSHVLEHCENPDKALAEAQRVADEVIVLVPHWWNLGNWFCPEHLWVFFDERDITKRTRLREYNIPTP